MTYRNLWTISGVIAMALAIGFAWFGYTWTAALAGFCAGAYAGILAKDSSA